MRLLSLLIFCAIIKISYQYCGMPIDHSAPSSNSLSPCNDMESFELCKSAQSKLNNYIKKVYYYTNDTSLFVKHNLRCSTHIYCLCTPDSLDDTAYCQNTDAIKLCLDAKMKLDVFLNTLNNNNVSLPKHITMFQPIINCANPIQLVKNTCNYISNAARHLDVSVVLWYSILCALYSIISIFV